MTWISGKITLAVVVTVALLVGVVIVVIAWQPSSPPEQNAVLQQTVKQMEATSEPTSQDEPEVIVATDSSTYDTMVTELYALALEDAGFEVDREYADEQDPAFAFEQGEVDLYLTYYGDPQNGETEGEERKLEGAMDAPMSYSVVMEKAVADQYGISDVSEFAEDEQLRVAAPDGTFDGTEAAIDRFWNVAVGDGEGGTRDVFVGSTDEALTTMVEGDAEAALGWNVNGEILEEDLVLLEDREDLIEDQTIYLTPLIRQEIASDHPEAARAINDLSAELTVEGPTCA